LQNNIILYILLGILNASSGNIPDTEREDIMQALHQIKHIDSTSLTLNLPKSFLNRTVEVTVVPRKSYAGKRHLKFKSFIMNPIKVRSIKPWTRDELYAR